MSNLVERSHGQGSVFSGERFIADVHYDMRVYQNYDETMLLSGQRIRTPTVQDIELDISAHIEAAFNERLTLHMADGQARRKPLKRRAKDMVSAEGIEPSTY